ncbi:hypothetical protein [Chitinophaga rhizophila]|uniref:Uncharacterized protein n=1 Tax=Chitinophaga rhizophila TaxID=2866212 RepID=A0ABS7GKU3_9BACT|nr:hypothetical protein [Chitinophaga rhizophila]MBW8687257.1 hypothetical protein [Chitinophaga rhizophila]
MFDKVLANSILRFMIDKRSAVDAGIAQGLNEDQQRVAYHLEMIADKHPQNFKTEPFSDGRTRFISSNPQYCKDLLDNGGFLEA